MSVFSLPNAILSPFLQVLPCWILTSMVPGSTMISHFRRRDWGTEKLGDLVKITELVSGSVPSELWPQMPRWKGKQVRELEVMGKVSRVASLRIPYWNGVMKRFGGRLQAEGWLGSFKGWLMWLPRDGQMSLGDRKAQESLMGSARSYNSILNVMGSH